MDTNETQEIQDLTAGPEEELAQPETQETEEELAQPETQETEELSESELEIRQLREDIKQLREYLSKKFTESERGDAGETDPIEDYLNSDNSLTHRILEKYERMK